MEMYQLFKMDLEYDGGAPGHLVFHDDDSNVVCGLVVDVQHGNDATVMLFEPCDIKDRHPNHYPIKETLTEEEMVEWYRKLESIYPGYLKWLCNMDPEDFRIGCPMIS